MTGQSRKQSAVTSRRQLFIEGDGNSPWARRYSDLVNGHIADLGGRDLLSDAELHLIKDAATIEVELEQMQGRLSLGEPVDLDLFTRSTSHLRRLFETIGLKRAPKPVMSHWDRMQVLRQEQADADIVAPPGAA
jgi:hypothetical protein